MPNTVRNWIKWIALFLTFLLIIVCPTALYISRSYLLTCLIEKVNDSVSGEVVLEDESISLSFPIVQFTSPKVALVNPKDSLTLAKNDTILQADSLSIAVDLMSFLSSGETKIVQHVAMSNLDIIAEVDELGGSNFQKFIDTKATDSLQIEDVDSLNTHFLQAFQDFPIYLDTVSISNISLRFSDKISKTRLSVEHADINFGGLLTGDSIHAALKIDSAKVNLFQGAKVKMEDREIGTNIAIRLSAEENVLYIDKGELKYNMITIPIVGSLKIVDSKHYYTNLSTQTNEMPFSELIKFVPFKHHKNDIISRGTAKFSASLEGTLNLDTLMFPQALIDIELKDGFLQHPTDPLRSINDLNLDLHLKNFGEGRARLKIDMNELGFSMLDQRFDAKLYGELNRGNSLFTGYVKSNLDLGILSQNMNLGKQVTGYLGVDLEFELDEKKIRNHDFSEIMADGFIQVDSFQVMNFNAETKPSLERLSLEITPEKATVKEMIITAGESDLQITGEIDHFLDYLFSGELLEINMDLKSNMFNYDQIYPAIEEVQQLVWTDIDSKMEKMSEVGELSFDEKAEVMSAVEIPDNLELNFNSTFNKILIQNDKVTNVEGLIQISDRTLMFKDISLNFLNSEVLLQGAYQNVSPDSIIMHGAIDAEAINVGIVMDFLNTRFPDLELDSLRVGGAVNASISMAAIVDSHYSILPETLQLLVFADGEQLHIGDVNNILEIASINTTIVINDEQLTIDQFEGNVFDGELAGTGLILFSDSTNAKGHFEVDLDNVDVKKAYASMSKNMEVVSEDFKLEGKVSLSMKADAMLDSAFQIQPETVKAHGNLVSDKLKLKRSDGLKELLDSLHVPFYRRFELTENIVKFHIQDRLLHIDPSKIRFNKYLGIAEGRFDRYGNMFMGAFLDIRRGDLPSDSLFTIYEQYQDVEEDDKQNKKKKNKRTLKSGAIIYGNIEEFFYDVTIKLNRDDSYELMKSKMSERKYRHFLPGVLTENPDSLDLYPGLFFL